MAMVSPLYSSDFSASGSPKPATRQRHGSIRESGCLHEGRIRFGRGPHRIGHKVAKRNLLDADLFVGEIHVGLVGVGAYAPH